MSGFKGRMLNPCQLALMRRGKLNEGSYCCHCVQEELKWVAWNFWKDLLSCVLTANLKPLSHNFKLFFFFFYHILLNDATEDLCSPVRSDPEKAELFITTTGTILSIIVQAKLHHESYRIVITWIFLYPGRGNEVIWRWLWKLMWGLVIKKKKPDPLKVYV